MIIVNPNGRIGNELEAIEPPVWAGFIANLENAPILDAEADDLTPEETAQRINEDVLIVVMGKNPSVSSTPKMPWVNKLIPLLKGNVKLTGIHPQALKEQTEIETGCEVVSYNPSDFTLMSGYDPFRYRAHNWHCLGKDRTPYGVIVTSFGCPFNCFYCNIHILYPKKVIYRKLDYIEAEMCSLADKGVKNVKFWDELFCLNAEWVSKVCDLIIGNYNFNIWCYGRVDTVDPKMLEKMKRAGINWIAYGMDSNKGTENIRNAIKITHDADINVMGNFMFGLPNEGDILNFAEELDIEWANFYEAKPYPGSQWYKESLEKDWESFNQYKGETFKRKDRLFTHWKEKIDRHNPLDTQ